MTPKNDRRLMDIPAAAKYLCMSERRVRKMAATGLLPKVVIGRTVRFDVGELDRWIESKKTCESDIGA